MKRKWIIAALVLLPILLGAAIAVITQSRGSISKFGFLREAKVVELERVKDLPSKATMRYEVYNVHRPFNDMVKEVEAELLPRGYEDISWFRETRRAWVKTSVPGTIPTGIVGTDLVSVSDGMSKIVPVSNPNEYDPIHTVEGWTTVVVATEYKPSWYEHVLDLFRGPVVKDTKHMDIQIVPSKAASNVYKRQGL